MNVAASFQVLQSLVEKGPDAISLIGRQGEILYANESNAKLFGYHPSDLVGRNCLDLLHPEDRDHSQSALLQVPAAEIDPIQWDARVRHKTGAYCWVECRASNFLVPPESPAIALRQRDIQQQRATDLKRQEKAEELVRSNIRLQEFAYIAAHDLREPLRAVSAFSGLLLQRGQLDSESQQLAQTVVDGAARMSVLIDDLLLFARTGTREPMKSVDLREAVNKALGNLVLEIHVSGATVLIDPMPVLNGNETQLVRLFQNLISNAVKYRSQRPLRVHIRAQQRGSDWVIEVQDNGVGIPEKQKSRIFLPFVRLAGRDVPGTGLGLAVCQKIVEGMGGQLSVDSHVGVGSTFSFTLLGEDAALLPLWSRSGADGDSAAMTGFGRVTANGH